MAVGWPAAVALGGSAALTRAGEAASAEDPRGARRGSFGICNLAPWIGAIPVLTPFPHISMHVVKTPGVRLEASHELRSVGVSAWGPSTVGKGPIEIGLRGAEAGSIAD